MSTDHSYESGDQDYGHNSFPREKRSEVGPTERTRPSLGRRRSKSPQSVNGIHRRRRRKMSW